MSNPELLKAYLAERDVSCPACGYNLRGLASEACPECRQQLMLHVTLQRPVTKSWLTTIIPLWIVGGGGLAAIAIVLIVAGDQVFPNMFEDLARGRDVEQWTMYLLAPLAVCSALAWTGWRLTRAKGRRWFNTSPHQTLIRNWCLATSIGVVVIWTAWLFSEVR